MIDEGGNASVGVDLEVLGAFVFLLFEIEADGLVAEAEFVQKEGYFPVIHTYIYQDQDDQE